MYNNFEQNNYSNLMFNQILTMTIIPLFTSFFTTIISSLLTDIKNLLEKIFNYFWNEYTKKNIIQFDTYIGNELNTDILPLIWYINKTKSITKGNLILFEEIINSKQNDSINMLLYPLNEQKITSNINNPNSNPYQNQNNNLNSDNNSDVNFTYFKINDTNNTFYYGINSNKICIMSYKSNIQQLGNFILEIKNQYVTCKRNDDKIITKEKEIFIDLYENQNNAQKSKVINKKVIPLIWYLNKNQLITKGILLDKSDQNLKNIYKRDIRDFESLIAMENNMTGAMENNIPIKTIDFNKNINDDNDMIIMPFVDQDNGNEINEKNTGSSNPHNFYQQDQQKNKQFKNILSLNSDKKIEIDKNIFCSFTWKKFKSDSYPYTEFITEYIVVSSNKYSILELSNYLDDKSVQYFEYLNSKKVINFLYNYVSDKTAESQKFVRVYLDKTQTFEHLFFEQKDEIMNEIKNFSNVDYFKRFGMKRKIGWLFVGPVGCGKTAIVTAIANELNRSIKNIPISLVKTNGDFESAFGELNYSNQTINSNTVVTVFDEIDSAFNINLIKHKNISDKNDEKKQNDQQSFIIINTSDNNKNINKIKNSVSSDDILNIGIILSKLDGNENQDGEVTIATCNDLSNLDPALYRNGRLKLIELKYAGQKEISQMIEKYCKITLNQNQKNKIRNDCQIQTLTIKQIIANCLLSKKFHMLSDDVDNLINQINDVKLNTVS